MASFGFISRSAIPRSMPRRRTSSTAALRPKRSRASWSCPDPRRWNPTTSRPLRGAARGQVREAFGEDLAAGVIGQVAPSAEKLVLGGEEREMTIMFSEVRGFTTISESYKHDPQGLTTLMNRFLTPLTNAILARKGTIDKYMGDAIMAFWNAPLDDTEHQLNACEAAVDMLERIDVLNKQRELEA